MIIALSTCVIPSISQEQKLIDPNSIGWFVFNGTLKLKPNMSIHTEYQWRRVQGFAQKQQDLFRTGFQFVVHPMVSLNAGYAYVETSPYGDYPGEFKFPEHRVFQQVVLKNPVGLSELSHRFTLEQRFVGKVTSPYGQREIDWIFLNRMRYRLRAEVPVYKKALSFICTDEIFIGWGGGLGTNVFDQNRLAILLGYKINPQIKIEAGYLNQIVQQGKRVNSLPVFQHNTGFLLSTHFNVDWSKRK
jgi:hypothetical protein